jgi:hypothetical protein
MIFIRAPLFVTLANTFGQTTIGRKDMANIPETSGLVFDGA